VLLLTTEKLEKGGKAKGTHGEEDKLAFGKHHVVSQSGDIPAYENPLVTPLLETYRFVSFVHDSCLPYRTPHA
jgi:protein lin-54